MRGEKKQARTRAWRGRTREGPGGERGKESKGGEMMRKTAAANMTARTAEEARTTAAEVGNRESNCEKRLPEKGDGI